MNTLGYTPLHLATGKNVTFPRASTGNVVTEYFSDDEGVRKIMERYYEVMKNFRETEFSRKF